MAKLEIPDKRSTRPTDYESFHRQGQMKRSWDLGVKQSKTGEMITIDDGLTWGSIGQILGYILGETESIVQEELFKKMRGYYPDTVRGKELRKKKSATEDSE